MIDAQIPRWDNINFMNYFILVGVYGPNHTGLAQLHAH